MLKKKMVKYVQKGEMKMAVTWGDLAQVTWGEVKDADITWGDLNTMDAREFFRILEYKVQKIKSEIKTKGKKNRLLEVISIVAGLCTILDFSIDIFKESAQEEAKIERQNMQAIVEKVNEIEELLKEPAEAEQNDTAAEDDPDDF